LLAFRASTLQDVGGIMERAPGDAARQTLLERGRARRVVAAETRGHDADPERVHVRARTDMIDACGGRALRSTSAVRPCSRSAPPLPG
jgi:hypothetical protein